MAITIPRVTTPVESGSRLIADPSVQMINRPVIRDITNEVKTVCDTQNINENWQERALKVVLLVAAAALIIASPHISMVALAMGATILGLVVAYEFATAIVTKKASATIENVHQKAMDYGVAEAIDRRQKEDEKKAAELEAAKNRKGTRVAGQGVARQETQQAAPFRPNFALSRAATS